VEALSQQHAPLEKLVKVLRTACSLEPVTDGKYILGLKSVGLAPPPAPQFTPTTADVSMRADEIACAALRRHLSAWFANEPGARLGDDPEALHDLRVTARRMDATLSLFAAYLPALLVRSRGALKHLLEILGAARDLDVQLGELRRFCLELPDAQRAAVEPFRRHLESERSRARARMLRALDSGAARKRIEDLTLAVIQPSLSATPRKEAMGVAVAPELIRSRFRKLRKAVRGLAPDASVDDYHSVRRRVKKLRYAIESVAAIYGKPADEMLKALRRLQDRLGLLQDVYLMRNRLLALAAEPPKSFSSQTVFLMGRLAERRCSAASDPRKQIEKAWSKARGRRWKALRAKLEDLRGGAAIIHEPAHDGPDSNHSQEPRPQGTDAG
jgi:triphosphatase